MDKTQIIKEWAAKNGKQYVSTSSSCPAASWLEEPKARTCFDPECDGCWNCCNLSDREFNEAR